MQRNLLRVSMRTAATGRTQNTPLRLTILLDNSGSMERPDRRQAVLQGFRSLSAQLNAADQVTLVSFASTARLLADKVPGNQGESLLQQIENLPSEGGTNFEAALLLAREKAMEQKLNGAQNRIVLLTDGAVNLGNANPDSLAKLVTQLRDSGIAFDAAGISAIDLNDEVLEALTRQGDGRYYLLDSAESANESFASQIAGSLRPSAQNVKVQIEFNPQRVGRYKLLGFEKHRLNQQDFRNDKVDAAEMAAAEAGVAVYQFEIKPNGTGDVGNVSVRFRDLSTGQMVENRWPIPFESNTPRLEQSEPSMQLAACSALFAAKLAGGPLADSVDLASLQNILANLPEQTANQPRVQQLRTMVDQAVTIGR
jgi:secreted protein with Ig-like and vWFA domain